MNHVFLFIAAFLLLLGLYPLAKRRSLLTVVFMLENTSLAIWNLCYFLQKESLYFISVNTVSQIQLLSALVFTNGFYYLSYLYPEHSRSISYRLNLSIVVVLTIAVLFSDFVSRAELVNGELVFIDGIGYALYGLYLIALVLLSLRNLHSNFRKHEAHRIGILLVAFGIALFACLGLLFGVLLPLFGNFDFLNFSTLGAIFPLMFFAYAITKHDFLDISVIISRNLAWGLTLLLVALTTALPALLLLQANPLASILMATLLALFWALCAVPLQQFLLTSAKRKFIRGWYDTEEVMNQLSELVSTQKNRLAIFQIIARELDRVLELEKVAIVVAVRDQAEQVSHYQFLAGGVEMALPLHLPISHPLLDSHNGEQVRYLEDCPQRAAGFLREQGYLDGRRCVVIALQSPDCLEGLVILGERSNQALFDTQDLRFFRRLVNYVSALFYRLTPMEKLERVYFENVQRLHEAQIQLIRAQKIESIVHATRQCHHEIRTPLNIIRLGLGRVKDLAGLQAYKTIAEEEIARALEIVDETLLITDVEQPGPDREGIFNLNDVIRRSLKLVQQDRYRLVTAIEQDIPVRGVFSDLQVVFANLIHNAAEAMQDGGTISIRSHMLDNQAVVEFSDTGRGIPEEIRERVWEPYYSGQATVAGNSTAGRGWGLTIVNRIIDEHHGTINFTSTVGQGTTFVLKLPLAAGVASLNSPERRRSGGV